MSFNLRTLGDFLTGVSVAQTRQQAYRDAQSRQQMLLKQEQDKIDQENAFQQATQQYHNMTLAEAIRHDKATETQDALPKPVKDASDINPAQASTVLNNTQTYADNLPPDQQADYVRQANLLRAQSRLPALPVPGDVNGTAPLNYGLPAGQAAPINEAVGKVGATLASVLSRGMVNLDPSALQPQKVTTTPYYHPDVKTQGGIDFQKSQIALGQQNYGLKQAQFKDEASYRAGLLKAKAYEDQLKSRGLSGSKAHDQAIEAISRGQLALGQDRAGIEGGRLELNTVNDANSQGRLGASALPAGKLSLRDVLRQTNQPPNAVMPLPVGARSSGTAYVPGIGRMQVPLAPTLPGPGKPGVVKQFSYRGKPVHYTVR